MSKLLCLNCRYGYQHVRGLSSHQAMVVIADNRKEMTTDFMRFVWDIVYQKVKARDKGAV